MCDVLVGVNAEGTPLLLPATTQSSPATIRSTRSLPENGQFQQRQPLDPILTDCELRPATTNTDSFPSVVAQSRRCDQAFTGESGDDACIAMSSVPSQCHSDLRSSMVSTIHLNLTNPYCSLTSQDFHDAMVAIVSSGDRDTVWSN